jgi:hypothetical protein
MRAEGVCIRAGSKPWNGSAWFLWVFYLCACIPRKLRTILHKTGHLLHGMHTWYLARINGRSGDHRWKGTVLGQVSILSCAECMQLM